MDRKQRFIEKKDKKIPPAESWGAKIRNIQGQLQKMNMVCANQIQNLQTYNWQYQLKFKTMNMKQKIMRQREPENTKHRYQTQASNYDSTPTLNRLRDPPHHNKQNKNNNNNYQQPENPKPQRFQTAKSSQFAKRLKTAVNQSDLAHFREKKPEQANHQIHSSQQFFRFRTKPGALRPQNAFISQQLTFAEVNHKKGLLTSREFMEQKKVKNQVIDEMIMNTKRGLCKSFNEFSAGCYCVNHPDKKAKYRLVSQLSEGEEQMFYCSKCAINLLQQNFKIQEVKAQDAQILNASRLQQITRLELKLKTLENEAQLQFEGTNNKEELEMIKQQLISVNSKFEVMIDLLQKMQRQQIEYLHGLYVKKQNEQNLRKENIGDLMLELKNMQKEIVQYKQLKKFASMKENEFQFITTSLTNKITKFAENIPQIVKISPSRKINLNCLDQRQILEKLEEEVTKRMEKQYTRRQREVTFSRKSGIKDFQKSQDQFICDELKRPFRVLFPSDEMEMGHSTDRYSDRNHMLQSVKQRPTFTQIE